MLVQWVNPVQQKWELFSRRAKKPKFSSTTFGLMTFDLIGIGPKGRFNAEKVIFTTGTYEITEFLVAQDKWQSNCSEH